MAIRPYQGRIAIGHTRISEMAMEKALDRARAIPTVLNLSLAVVQVLLNVFLFFALRL